MPTHKEDGGSSFSRKSSVRSFLSNHLTGRSNSSRRNEEPHPRVSALPPPRNNPTPTGSPFGISSPPTRRPPVEAPPPAYTESPNAASGPTLGASPAYERYANGAHPPIPAQAASTDQDPYAFLSSFDTIFLIDDSGSMAGRSWRETRAALAAIVPIATEHDTDGVDVFFLNHKTNTPADLTNGIAGTGYRGVRSLAEVENMFNTVRPSSYTPTGQRLNNILRPYLRHYEQKINETQDETCMKPINIIVVTDGVPSDEVDEVIIQAAKKLDKLDAPPYQIGIQFFQVGNEPGAADALKALDDQLSNQVEGGIRDIVDTVTFDSSLGGEIPVLTADGILKTVLGSVVKRLDRIETGQTGATSARNARR